MATSFFIVAQNAIRTALIIPPTGVWSDRVYFDSVPPTAIRPYIVYNFVGGGEVNAIRPNDMNIAYLVKIVAESFAEAAAGEAEIANRLNNRGAQDTTAGALVGDQFWDISAITRENSFSVSEYLSETTRVYHLGAYYRVIMESK